MKFLNKINTATKIVILVVYTIILAAIAVLIINASNVINESEGYGVKALDENIQITTKITETRTHSTKTTNENANWNLYFHITQRNENVEVSDIEIFAKGKTRKGGTIYFEKSKASENNYTGTPCTSGTSFKSFTSNFKKSVSSSGEITDTELERVFVRVVYKVKANDKISTKELKYYHNLFNQYTEKYDKFDETKKINSNNVYQDMSSEAIGYYNAQMRIQFNEEKTTDESNKYDYFYSKFNFNEGKFNEEGKYITDSSIVIVAKVKHDSKDTNNVFSDYVKLLELYGVPLNQNINKYYTNTQVSSINSFYGSQNSINTLYEVEELYMFVSLTNSSGTTTYHCEKIELPNK